MNEATKTLFVHLSVRAHAVPTGQAAHARGPLELYRNGSLTTLGLQSLDLKRFQTK